MTPRVRRTRSQSRTGAFATGHFGFGDRARSGHRVLHPLNWPGPDNLSSRLCFEDRWLVCEGIDATPLLRGGFIDYHEFGKARHEEGPCLLKLFVPYRGDGFDDRFDVLSRQLAGMLIGNLPNELGLR